jgi:hypothetical protein
METNNARSQKERIIAFCRDSDSRKCGDFGTRFFFMVSEAQRLAEPFAASSGQARAPNNAPEGKATVEVVGRRGVTWKRRLPKLRRFGQLQKMRVDEDCSKPKRDL